MVPLTRPRTVNSRATTLPTTVAPAAIVISVPRSSPSMLQRISHGPSQTMLPMIGASARSAQAPALAAAPTASGASGATGILAVALPDIVPHPPRSSPQAITSRLVSRFRSSPEFEPEVRNRTRGKCSANFGFAALGDVFRSANIFGRCRCHGKATRIWRGETNTGGNALACEGGLDGGEQHEDDPCQRRGRGRRARNGGSGERAIRGRRLRRAPILRSGLRGLLLGRPAHIRGPARVCGPARLWRGAGVSLSLWPHLGRGPVLGRLGLKFPRNGPE